MQARTINNECNKPPPQHHVLKHPHPYYYDNLSGDVSLSWFLPLTLQQLGVYEQLQRQQHNHQNDTGHQETVEACRQQTDLPQCCPSPTAWLQPVRPDRGEGEKRQSEELKGGKINGGSCCVFNIKCNTGTESRSDRQQARSNQ